MKIDVRKWNKITFESQKLSSIDKLKELLDRSVSSEEPLMFKIEMWFPPVKSKQCPVSDYR